MMMMAMTTMMNFRLRALTFFECFRIQKDRVGDREKDLEVLQERLAEKVSYCCSPKRNIGYVCAEKYCKD